MLTEEIRVHLDGLLIPDPITGQTPLSWLRRGAVTHSPRSILDALEKIAVLRGWGVAQWDLSTVNPNRRKFLAQLGQRSTNQALQRIAPERRYPILLAFLHQMLEEIVDEAIDLFDGCLAAPAVRGRRSTPRLRRPPMKSCGYSG